MPISKRVIWSLVAGVLWGIIIGWGVPVVVAAGQPVPAAGVMFGAIIAAYCFSMTSPERPEDNEGEQG